MILPVIAIVIILVSIISLAGMVILKNNHQSCQKESHSLTPDQIPLSSYHTLNEAIKKAQAILARAELEAINIVATSKHYTRELEEKSAQEFSQNSQRLESVFSQEITMAEKEYLQYLQQLKAQAEQTQSVLSDTVRQRTDELFERFEQNLSAFLTQTQQQSLAAIDLELRAARQLIDTYKVQQLNLVDENIVAILERTLSLVLSKKLSLAEHIELVYESLEKAKAEKFIL